MRTSTEAALLEGRDLAKAFPVRRGMWRRTVGEVRAVDGVDVTLLKGECFGLVGESGSGKTTLGRLLLRLEEPSRGSVRFRGRNLLALGPAELRRQRRHFQMIFQDPYGSLNPRMRVARILAEPLAVHLPGTSRRGRRERAAELLRLVGLPETAGSRFPHEFSGGQRQRIGIARALAPSPDLLVADEPVSALDVSVRAQIVNLLAGLQRRLGLSVLFIAHDLAIVEQIADRVAVMYLGRIVERAATARLFGHPQHPYTMSLLASVPRPDPASRIAVSLEGEVPSALEPPSGCPFHPRCPIARERCAEEVPLEQEVVKGHLVACHYPGETLPAPPEARVAAGGAVPHGEAL